MQSDIQAVTSAYQRLSRGYNDIATKLGPDGPPYYLAVEADADADLIDGPPLEHVTEFQCPLIKVVIANHLTEINALLADTFKDVPKSVSTSFGVDLSTIDGTCGALKTFNLNTSEQILLNLPKLISQIEMMQIFMPELKTIVSKIRTLTDPFLDMLTDPVVQKTVDAGLLCVCTKDPGIIDNVVVPIPCGMWREKILAQILEDPMFAGLLGLTAPVNSDDLCKLAPIIGSIIAGITLDPPPEGSPLTSLSPESLQELFLFKPQLLSLLECTCPSPVPKTPGPLPPIVNWKMMGLVSIVLLALYIPLAVLFGPLWPALILGGLLLIGLIVNPMCTMRPCIVQSGLLRPVSEPTLYTGKFSVPGISLDTSLTLLPNQTLLFTQFTCTGDQCPSEMNTIGITCNSEPVAISPIKDPEGYQLSGPCIDQLKKVGSPPLLQNAWLGVNQDTGGLFLQLSVNTPLGVIALSAPLQVNNLSPK